MAQSEQKLLAGPGFAISAVAILLAGLLFVAGRNENSFPARDRNITDNERHAGKIPFRKGHSPTFGRGSTANVVADIRHLLASTEDADHEFCFDHLLPDLLERDPAMAAGLLDEIEPGAVREDLLHRIAQRWGERDASPALAWATALANPEERETAAVDVCLHMAEANPVEALFQAQGLPLGKQKIGVIENLVHQWAEKDFLAASAWANARPAGDEKEKLLARLAFVQSRTAPVDAARLVAEQISSVDIQTEAAISVLHQWASHDLAGAAAWVSLFPEGPLRHRAQHELEAIESYRSGVSSPASPVNGYP